MASGDPFSPEYQAAYNSTIDLLSREIIDRARAQQIQRSPRDLQGQSTFQPPLLERMKVSLDEHAPSTSALEPGDSTLTPEDLSVLAIALEPGHAGHTTRRTYRALFLHERPLECEILVKAADEQESQFQRRIASERTISGQSWRSGYSSSLNWMARSKTGMWTNF
jgi:hypothetical protein